MPRIALIGDRDDAVPAHRAIPLALDWAAKQLNCELQFDWLGTETIDSAARLSRYDGVWCVPASPYRDAGGALLAILHAREAGLAFLGTCGGFQHAALEYARNVLGWSDAEHAETAPQATRAVIVPLACALVEVEQPVTLRAGSRIAQAYGDAEATEGYRCRFGVAPALRDFLITGPLRATASDPDGDIRAVELDAHPFFVATLFQPERAALQGRDVPLARAFLRAAGDR